MGTPGLELTVGGCTCCECPCLPYTLDESDIQPGSYWDITEYTGVPLTFYADSCPISWRLLSYNDCACEVLYEGSITDKVLVGLPSVVTNNGYCPIHVILQLGCPWFAFDCSIPSGSCTPTIVASFTTNPDNPVWDLTPYQDPYSVTQRCAQWRVVEIGFDRVYYSGVVSDTGILVDLPDDYTSPYSYNGYMELQIGCMDCETGVVTWPDSTPPPPNPEDPWNPGNPACPCCTDVLAGVSFEVTFPDDQCNTGCCGTISGTFMVDINAGCQGDLVGDQCYCSTDTCDQDPCDYPLLGNGEGVVCCQAEGDPCDYSSLPEPHCISDQCNDVPGCSGYSWDTPPSVTQDTNCVSNVICGTEEDPGYGCERIVNCTGACQCGYIQPTVTFSLVCGSQEPNIGDHVHLTGSVTDGVRVWTFDYDLGNPYPINCASAISGITLTLTESTLPGYGGDLCGQPTVVATAY